MALSRRLNSYIGHPPYVFQGWWFTKTTLYIGSVNREVKVMVL